jgi:hypothetical protein
MNCKLCRIAEALKFFIITKFKIPINLITDPNLVSGLQIRDITLHDQSQRRCSGVSEARVCTHRRHSKTTLYYFWEGEEGGGL